ncbi:hypothetical protein FQR65_LT00861 [Abscondita terminalis]|nr:hypothetical protein FQR65_LT00861 [Abscondita terminalis]
MMGPPIQPEQQRMLFLLPLAALFPGMTPRKTRLYQHKRIILDELKEAIRVEVATVEKATLERVFGNFQEKLQQLESRTPFD